MTPAPLTVKVWKDRVWLKKGEQAFMMAYEPDGADDLEWYAQQLRRALGIDAEQETVARSKADDFHRHELLDRAATVMGLFNLLFDESHPAIQDLGVEVDVDATRSKLFELYQTIGAKVMP